MTRLTLADIDRTDPCKLAEALRREAARGKRMYNRYAAALLMLTNSPDIRRAARAFLRAGGTLEVE